MIRARTLMSLCVVASVFLTACAGTTVSVTATTDRPSTSVEAATTTLEAPGTTTATTIPETTASTTTAGGSDDPDIAAFRRTLNTYLTVTLSDETVDDLDIEDLYENALGMCASLDAGNSLAQAGGEAFTGVSVGAVGALMLATIDAVCPRHAALKEALLTAATGSPDEQFLGAVRAVVDAGFVDEFGEQELIDLGRQACERLDDGESLLAIYTDVLASDFTQAQNLGVAIGAAIGVYCPQHINALSELAEGLGE